MKAVNKFLSVVVILIVLIVLALGYGIVIEPNLLTVKNIEIGNQITSSKKIRVVQFSDTHLDNNYNLNDLKKLVKIINQQNPDIVVFTGDFIDKVEGSDYPEAAAEHLHEISATYGKYAVFGNHDYGAQGHKYYNDMMVKSDFKVLINSSVVIDTGSGRKIKITGLDDSLLGNPDYKKVSSLLDEDYFNILLMHEPDEVEHFIEDPFDLALAGHSHGGQIRLPFVGAVKTPPLGKKYTKGLYEFDGDKKMFVSSGIGTTSIPIRILNIPEIVTIDIYM